MKILYITYSGEWKNRYSDENQTIDFKSILQTITKGIKERFPEASIVLAKELYGEDGEDISHDKLNEFDLAICDISAHHPNVHYIAGVFQGKGKPVVYFSNGNYVPIDVGGANVLMYSEASLNKEFINELNDTIERAQNDPAHFLVEKNERNVSSKAFISYSHKDRDYLNRLMVHLRPLEKKGMIDIWQDNKIKIGDRWKDEIDKALSRSNIAILLLSADFMASDFIIENELPPLLAEAEVKGTKIVPVIISPCRFDREPSLNRFQAANLPSEPLSKMNEANRESIYDKIASEIESAIGKP